MNSEDKLQAQCFQWAWNNYPGTRRLLFAVPNGGHRDIREAMKFKATGVVAGVHDLIFYYDNVLYTFELKKREGLKMSAKQKLFADQVRKQGGKSYLITDFENFKKIFENIVNN